MEKIVLVHYINYPQDRFAKVISMLEAKLKNEDVIPYFIYTTGESRVECINPVLVSEDEFSKAKQVLERADKMCKEIAKTFENMAKAYPDDSELGEKVGDMSNK